MRNLKQPLLAAVLALSAITASAAVTTVPAGAEAREARLLGKLSPQARDWIKQEARHEAASNTVSQAAASRAATAAAPGLNLAGMSVEDLVMLLMMEISRDAEQDMKQTLAAMDQARARKQAMRDANDKQKSAKAAMNVQLRHDVAASQPRQRVARSAELDAYLAREKASKDSLSEMSEEEQLKLQMAMDRRSKALETISNLMKKASDTQQGVVKNIK